MHTVIRHKDISVIRDGDKLILKNQAIERTFDLSCGAPRTIALQDHAENDFASSEKKEADLSFLGLHRPTHPYSSWEITEISAKVREADFLDGEAVIVSILMHETKGDTWYRREYFIYPELAVIAVQNFIRSAVCPIIYWAPRGSLEGLGPIQYPESESCADSIALPPGMEVLKTVIFHGRTDLTDNIVEENLSPAAQECARGNLLLCRHPANGHGLFFLQEAPPSNERRDFEQYDFRIKDGNIYSCCWGIHPGEFVSGQEYCSYRHVLGIFHNDVERTVVLKNYLKKRFPFDVAKNATVMVNPWGCGHFRELASEEFIKNDMAAGAEAGASHYQIDDGWQSGGGLAELSVKNRKITRDFWKISEKFTDRSFEHVTAHGRAHGIEGALWLAPSCNCDYEDWEEFADLILDFYHKYSIRFFKIDSVLLRTCRSEQNLRAMLTKVRRETNGDVLFDLDTTNGQRCGYFHFLEFGNIFLENRYTMGGLGYHPEKLLHTVWMMSRYMNPFMLQIEIPDPDNVSTEFYETHPHGDFRCYPMDYMAMLTMFASPLLWLTPSTLSAANRKIIREVMLLHKEHRQKIASGIVFSVGREPDTRVMTGLQSHDFEDNSGYLLFFREKNCFMDSDILPLHNIPQNAKWKILAGAGSITEGACKGTYQVTVKNSCGYLFMRYEA